MERSRAGRYRIMNILVLGLEMHRQVMEKLLELVEDLSVQDGEASIQPGGPWGVDILVGSVSGGRNPDHLETLLNWRTHAHTYMIPCWINGWKKSFEPCRLWPRLSIDRFQETLELAPFREWLREIQHWQQNRMQLAPFNTLDRCAPLEIVSSLALRRAGGRLVVYGEEGQEGSLVFWDGCLVGAAVKHLREEEAFHEFLSWSSGSYCWEADRKGDKTMSPRPIEELIREGLALMREAGLLHHFVRDPSHCLRHTGSQSALDDAAVPIYPDQTRLYSLIDGRTTARAIIEASPLSRPRTMSCLAKWFSLGDIEREPPQEDTSSCRVLVVDDSPLMCRALESIFSGDSRLEVVGFAHDGRRALELIDRQNPDVVTLDLQMPSMDGLTTLKHIMIRKPTPVVVLSAFTQETSPWTYESFKYGAVDVIPKPGRPKAGEAGFEKDLTDRVTQASRVRMQAARYIRRVRKPGETLAADLLDPFQLERLHQCRILVVCGTGGVPSLLKLLLSQARPGWLAPMIACIAMPARVVASLLPNLKKDIPVRIEALEDPSSCKPGVVYLCSADEIPLDRANLTATSGLESDPMKDGGPLDDLLSVLAQEFKSRLLAMLISGSGSDGIRGMERVRRMGGESYVLSPEVCLRPDLPRKILELELALEVKSAQHAVDLFQDWNERMMATVTGCGGSVRVEGTKSVT